MEEEDINKKSKVLITPLVKKEKSNSLETREERENTANISEEEKKEDSAYLKRFRVQL